MTELLDWASAQPVWFQVVIGLVVFFVVLPLALAALVYLFHVLNEVFWHLEPMLAALVWFFKWTLIVVAAAALSWYLLDSLANFIAFRMGDALSLPPQSLAQAEAITVAALVSVIAVALIAFFLRPMLSTMKRWRDKREPDAKDGP